MVDVELSPLFDNDITKRNIIKIIGRDNNDDDSNNNEKEEED